MLDTRALLLASLLGTLLQVAMVVAGHYNKSVASLFAVGGMGLSLVAGLLYAAWARGGGTWATVAGGLAAGAICAFLGILVSHLLGDVPRSLLVLGTISSAVTGALGGWLGTFLFRSGIAAVALVALVSGSASAQNVGPIVAEGIVEAPLDTVWVAWSTSDGLRGWLAPHAEIDLRVGGLMRTNYDSAGVLGDRRTIENAVLSFEPGRSFPASSRWRPCRSARNGSGIPVGFPLSRSRSCHGASPSEGEVLNGALQPTCG